MEGGSSGRLHFPLSLSYPKASSCVMIEYPTNVQRTELLRSFDRVQLVSFWQIIMLNRASLPPKLHGNYTATAKRVGVDSQVTARRRPARSSRPGGDSAP
eukprot:scaffold52566_cov60-Phaeocystis_antarctica.AAC.5